MIGMALPFAQSSVVVVAPKGFTLDKSLLHVAKVLGKGVGIVPMSYFSDAVVKRLQTNYGVERRVTEEGDIINPLAISLLGKKPDCYRHLVPKWLCDRVGRARNPASA